MLLNNINQSYSSFKKTKVKKENNHIIKFVSKFKQM